MLLWKIKRKKIQYVQTMHKTFWRVDPGTPSDLLLEEFKPVCFIKELSGGRVQVDMHDSGIGWVGINQKVNTRMILYPNTIKEIKYTIKE